MHTKAAKETDVLYRKLTEVRKNRINLNFKRTETLPFCGHAGSLGLTVFSWMCGVSASGVVLTPQEQVWEDFRLLSRVCWSLRFVSTGLLGVMVPPNSLEAMGMSGCVCPGGQCRVLISQKSTAVSRHKDQCCPGGFPALSVWLCWWTWLWVTWNVALVCRRNVISSFMYFEWL